MDKDLQNVLQEKFHNFAPSPSRDLWVGIEREIRTQKPVFPRQWAMAASIALLFSLGFLWSTSQLIDEQEFVAHVKGEKSATEQAEILPSPIQIEAAAPILEEVAIASKPEVLPAKPSVTTKATPSLAANKPQLLPEPEIKGISLQKTTQPVLTAVVVAPATQGLSPIAAAENIQARKMPKIQRDPLQSAGHVLAFASEDLKNWPEKSLFQFDNKTEEKKGEKVSTFKFGFGAFRITRKRHRQTISKNNNS